MQVQTCWAWKARPKSVFLGRWLRLTLRRRSTSIVTENLLAQQSPEALPDGSGDVLACKQFGQCSRSRSNTRLSSAAQPRRSGRSCSQYASHLGGIDSWADGSGAWGTSRGASRGTSRGTTSARGLALRASTPWKR